KRKGSFVIVTLGVYLVLIFAGLIAGILMAPAYIDQQSLDLIAQIAPVPVPQQQKEAPKPEKIEINKNVDVRRVAMVDVSRADLVPKEISTKTSDVLPLRHNVQTVICPTCGNSNATAPMAPGSGTGQLVSAPKVEISGEPPPPPPKPAPHAPISGGVLN